MKIRYKRVVLLVTISMTFLLQSCIEIVEKIEINDDQSGNISILVSAGNNSPLMAILGRYIDFSFMDQIKYNAEQYTNALRQQGGIHNVKLTDHLRSGEMELSFDFENDKKLNNALYAAAGEKKTIFSPSVYKIREHKFVRKNTTGWISRLIKQEEDNIPDEVVFDLIEIESIYCLPQKAKNIRTSCKLATSNKEQCFTTRHNLSDLLENKVNTFVKIRY